MTAAGGEMIPMTPIKWKKTDFPKAKNLKSQEVFEDVLTADVLINVPIAKDHGMSTLTLGMKNLMGIVSTAGSTTARSAATSATSPARSAGFHACRRGSDHDPQRSRRWQPRLLEKRDTVIASTDIVAVDAYATTLFGMKPDALESTRMGQADGLGTFDLASLKIAEIKR